jgi:chemotaxis protein MotA
LSVLNTVKNAFFHKENPPETLIPKLVGFATIARREGILALESHASEAEDEFLEKSVQLAIDGTSPELIKDILTTELAFMEDRHAMGQSILLAMGTFSPAFGMIGTLIGLVQMLATLDDPAKIGEGMAVALLTTLYGALMANVVFLPAAGKLKVRTSNELLAKELVIEGILSIQSGDNPRVVEQKLKAFVSPAVRRQVSSR